ncbi:MAG: YjfI family protein [Lysobacter sp.]|nr:YjfI family protein [Lysobacter sp.]
MNRLTTHEIHQYLARHFATEGQATLELVEGSDPALNIVLHGYGDMELQLAAVGEQVFVSTVLFAAADVADRDGLNDACLRLNPLNPLSNLGLVDVDGRDAYIVFGELSSASSHETIVEEILTLADNTIAAAEALRPYL